MAQTTDFEGFSTWAQLLDHIKGEYRLFYQAPMDYRPVIINATIRRDGKVRVTPVYSDADPFTADQAHLERFKRHASRRSITNV